MYYLTWNLICFSQHERYISYSFICVITCLYYFSNYHNIIYKKCLVLYVVMYVKLSLSVIRLMMISIYQYIKYNKKYDIVSIYNVNEQSVLHSFNEWFFDIISKNNIIDLIAVYSNIIATIIILIIVIQCIKLQIDKENYRKLEEIN